MKLRLAPRREAEMAITIGSKIRAGYPFLKCGTGLKCGQPFRLYGKRIPGKR